MVSIGMPVFNAEATLGPTIDALLSQSLGDFELIISDNASTDATSTIVADYAQRDSRIVSLRQARNIGANGNYSAVFRAARGRYFKWASSNDWCAPTFLERCVAHLEANQDVAVVLPRTRLFESDPAIFIEYKQDLHCRQDDPVDRFVWVGKALALNNVLNGVVRADVLRRTRLIEHYPGADDVLIAHLALLGRIEVLDEPLFYRRMDRSTATRLMSAEAVHRHHYPSRTWRSLFPSWRLTGGQVRVVLGAGLSPRQTLRALGWVARTAYWRRSDLRRDLVQAMWR
jgi:glycosyltransferase involved in cell wall biosynthesis